MTVAQLFIEALKTATPAELAEIKSLLDVPLGMPFLYPMHPPCTPLTPQGQPHWTRPLPPGTDRFSYCGPVDPSTICTWVNTSANMASTVPSRFELKTTDEAPFTVTSNGSDYTQGPPPQVTILGGPGTVTLRHAVSTADIDEVA